MQWLGILYGYKSEFQFMSQISVDWLWVVELILCWTIHWLWLILVREYNFNAVAFPLKTSPFSTGVAGPELAAHTFKLSLPLPTTACLCLKQASWIIVGLEGANFNLIGWKGSDLSVVDIAEFKMRNGLSHLRNCRGFSFSRSRRWQWRFFVAGSPDSRII